jgi:hypothetical protein
MGIKWVERFHIYVLNVGNLAAGASSVADLPLPLDSDAPFVLRGRGGRCQNDPNFLQAGMNGLLVRYRDAQGNYASDAPVPWYLDVPTGGYGGQWAPVWPQRVYPQQGSLLTTVYNTGPGAVDLTNVQLYYVGTKRYPATQPYSTYPQKCSVKDFTYSYWSKSVLNPQLPFQGSLMAPSEQRLYIPITIQTDADFVLRQGQVGIYGSQPDPYFYMELFMLLMDQWRKPYMNAPVHVDWLFGGGSKPAIATEGNTYLPNNSQSIFKSLPGLTSGIIPGQTPLSGNWHPGLIYPEIYNPANSQFYFNLIRNDAGYTDAYNPDGSIQAGITPPDINLHIAFQGSKVFHR